MYYKYAHQSATHKDARRNKWFCIVFFSISIFVVVVVVVTCYKQQRRAHSFIQSVVQHRIRNPTALRSCVHIIGMSISVQSE